MDMDLLQRIKEMEQKWANFGYPIDPCEEVKESPQKKLKLDTSQDSKNESGSASEILPLSSYVLESLSNRIEVLEEKWQAMFADLHVNSKAENGKSTDFVTSNEQELRANDDQAAASVAPLELSVNEQVFMLLTERMSLMENQWSKYFDGLDKSKDKGVSAAEAPNKESSTAQVASIAESPGRPVDPYKSAVFDVAYECRICSEMIPHFEDLRYHLETSHQLITEKVFECSICRVVFQSSEHFAKHNKEFHNPYIPRVKQCRVCNARFPRKCILKHFRRHIFKNCDPCHEAFKHAAASQDFENFMTHLTEHNGSEPNPVFKCQECKLLFKNKAEETEHFHANHELNCGFCNLRKPLTSLQYLHAHLKDAHGILRSGTGICPVCSGQFPSVSALMSHIVEYHENKLIKCQFCQKLMCYASEEDREAHMKKFHSKKTKKNKQKKKSQKLEPKVEPVIKTEPEDN